MAHRNYRPLTDDPSKLEQIKIDGKPFTGLRVETPEGATRRFLAEGPRGGQYMLVEINESYCAMMSLNSYHTTTKYVTVEGFGLLP